MNGLVSNNSKPQAELNVTSTIITKKRKRNATEEIIVGNPVRYLSINMTQRLVI